jgi:hypothetical protein
LSFHTRMQFLQNWYSNNQLSACNVIDSAKFASISHSTHILTEYKWVWEEGHCYLWLTMGSVHNWQKLISTISCLQFVLKIKLSQQNKTLSNNKIMNHSVEIRVQTCLKNKTDPFMSTKWDIFHFHLLVTHMLIIFLLLQGSWKFSFLKCYVKCVSQCYC